MPFGHFANIALIIASTNPHKCQEIQTLLADLNVTVQSMAIDVLEDGITFEENALKKLENLPPKPDTFYLADDSGIEVTSLNGRPGIHSARYPGPEALLQELAPHTDRSAQFVCVIALKFPDGSTQTLRGVVKGTIAPQMQGQNGFGYDPIFIPKGFTKTYGELGDTIKAQTSHRAKALEKVKNRLLALG